MRCHTRILPGRCLSSAPSALHRPTLALPRAPSLQRWCEHSESASGPTNESCASSHTASPLNGLAQRNPGPPRHPEAGLTPMLHSTGHEGAAAGDDRSRSRLGRPLSFPALRTRAAGHRPPRPTHIASRLARVAAGSLHPGPLANASSPRTVHLSTRHAHRRISRGLLPGE